MGNLLGKLALPLVGVVLFGSCSPDTGSAVLNVDTGNGQTDTGGTGGEYNGYYPGETGGFMAATGGYGAAATGATGAMPGTGGMGASGPGTGGTAGMVTASGGAAATGATTTTGGASPMGTGGAGTATGGTNAGTGGARPTGGTSSATGGREDTTGTGGSEEPPNNGEWTVQSGGYVTVGTLKGYAWTGASGGATIDPEDFSGLAPGDPLCVTGTVPATEGYKGVAMIGLNVNQPRTGSTKGSEYTPTGSGLKVTVDNNGDSPLRLQVQGPGGDWCTDLPSSGSGSFSWSDFTVDCWDTGGEAYDPSEPIVSVIVLVPGGGLEDSDIPFDFCLTSVEEIP